MKYLILTALLFMGCITNSSDKSPQKSALVQMDTTYITDTLVQMVHDTVTLKGDKGENILRVDTLRVMDVDTLEIVVVEKDTLIVEKVLTDTLSITDTVVVQEPAQGISNDTLINASNVADVFVYAANGTYTRKRYDLSVYPGYTFMHQESSFKGAVLHGQTKVFYDHATCGKFLLKDSPYILGEKTGTEKRYSCDMASGKSYLSTEAQYLEGRLLSVVNYDVAGEEI